MAINLNGLVVPSGTAIPPTNPQKPDQNALVTFNRPSSSGEFNASPETALQAFTRLAADGLAIPVGQNGSFNARMAQLGVQFNPKPNPLNMYANYTYHVRFFMTNEIQAYNNIDSNNPNSSDMSKMVIAESGVTAGFNIVSLVTTAVCGGNGSKRAMWSNTEYELTISEPLGLSLMDKIYFGARDLNVINHMRCPYFIEVWFRGYNEDGSLAEDNMFYSINRVSIMRVDSRTTHVGTKYTMKLVNDNSWAEMNSVATPAAGIKIIATTLGEFFAGLEAAWNDMDANINQDGFKRNIYKIDIPDAWKPWLLKANDNLRQNARNTPMEAVIDGNSTVISIARGQSIESIVDYTVYLCQEAQKWITGENSAGPGAASLEQQAMIRYVTVYPKIKILGPKDPVTGDYVREITYYLVPTESTKAYVDMETVRKALNLTTKTQKLAYLIQNDRVAKMYDYIYTGKNTEVLRFDINMDNMWAIYQPVWNQSNSYDQYTIGPTADVNSVGYQTVKGLLKRTQPTPQNRLQEIDSILGGQNVDPALRQSLLEEKAQLQRNVADATATSRQLAREGASSPTTTSSTSNNVYNGRAILASQGAGDAAREAAAAREQQDTLSNFYNNVSGSNYGAYTSYIEDVANGQIAEPPYLPVVGQFSSVPTQQQARQSADQTKIGNLQDPRAFPPGTGFVGAIFGNIFEDKAFLKIDLEIRGDPWWIPIGNIQQDAIAAQLVGNQLIKTNSTQASFLPGDNGFILEFRPGVKIDEATGLADVTSTGTDFFTGLYMVSEVVNVFSGGKFVQTLRAFKEILSDVPQSTPLQEAITRTNYTGSYGPPGSGV